MTDSQLLTRYINEHDEVSFQALVVRHGPMVLRACRRVLSDPHEIEDVFQATFLVLVRKAPKIRDPEALGNWLHGVAYRIAARTRRDKARRCQHERRRAEMQPSHGVPDPSWDDLGPAVREELDRLPAAYRVPLTMCYLRGLGHEEAAAELGWPLGTLKTRLVRGRRRLRGRLERRGLAPGLGLLLLLLLPRRAPAVPRELVVSTVDAMRLEANGGPGVAGPRFAEASRLAGDYVRTRIGSTRVWSLVILLAAALGTAGGVTFHGQSRAAEVEQFAALPANLTDVLNVACR